ncbi:MAG: hypothetical protein RUMPE_01335 [Eubacteriales bacterium SKADARSKE-1]|nr:hypothetical protein [Eubacteriales bacterium SKADARSKE-1]
MDLIYTDKNLLDMGILTDYELDLEIGSENDFQITTTTENNVIPIGAYFYFENTEYGGKVTTLKVDTRATRLYYGGKTFYGMLTDKIICPDSGQDYYTVSGDANSVIAGLITLLGLSDLFEASSDTSGFTLTNYQFDRYIDCLSGLSKMLKTKNAKLQARFLDRKVVLSAVAIADYSSEEFSSDTEGFTILQDKAPVNHLICLGKGDLVARTVVNLYTDASGNVSTTQYYTGLDEVSEVYDCPNIESEDELTKSGTEKLTEKQAADKIDITIQNTEKDVGDIVGGQEVITGLKVSDTITKKIVKISCNGDPKFTYEVGS